MPKSKPEVVEEISEPVVVQKEPESVPEVQIVFDDDLAALWLHEAGVRMQNVVHSIRVALGEGTHPSHVYFILYLLANAIAPEYKFQGEVFPGILWVPEFLAGSEALASLERCYNQAGYIGFCKKA